MDEYISREEVLSRIYATHSTGGFANEEAYLWLHDSITNLPSADVQPVKQDTELSIILQDYGIKDTDTLRYILDQYQKIIVDITGGQMSYLTYSAETVIACADDNYRKCYEESMKHGRWIDFPECLEYEGALDEEYFVCSECHHVWNTIDNCAETFRYCPNCGSKNEDGDSDD